MSRGRRYDGEPKLNFKKVFMVIVAIAIIVGVVFLIRFFLIQGSDKGKIESKSYFSSFKNNKWGVIDSNGEDVIDPSYQEFIVIPNSKNDVFVCTYDVDYDNNTYKTKALNNSNEEIFTDYSQVEAIQNSDDNGNIWYEENVLKVKKDDKYGLIDLSGKELLPIQYQDITPIQGIKNAFKIKENEKIGICNDEGTIIIKPEYIDITNLGKESEDGYIFQSENKMFGLVDYSNKQILEPKYDEIQKVSGNNLYVVNEQGKTKVIDKTGKDIITKGFDSIVSISKSTGTSAGIIFKKDEKYGLMDLSGEIKIKATYDKLSEANIGILIAKKVENYGVIDIDENEKISFDYNKITYNKEADVYITEDVNYNSLIFDNNFEQKLTGILVDIDTQKDYIKMRTDNEYKYYNFKFEEEQEQEIFTTNTLFLSKQDGKYGFVDKTGKVIVDYEYDDATPQNTCGYAGIKKDGKWGSIDSKGNTVIEPTYNLDDYLAIDFIGKWHKGLDLNMNYYNQE